jgi:hypothetical protein
MTLQVISREQIIAALEQLPPERWPDVVEFIRFLQYKSGAPRPQRATVHKAFGLLATDRPAPTDAEVQQWLEERRLRKYA